MLLWQISVVFFVFSIDPLGPLALSLGAINRLLDGKSPVVTAPVLVAEPLLDRDDHSMNEGIVKSRGLYLFEVHMNSVGMASGLFILIALTVVCVVCFKRGMIQDCSWATTATCCVQRGGGVQEPAPVV